jgi:exodeoxyribonuclease VII large subunit
MNQLPLFRPLAWSVSVSELTRYLRDLLEGDETLQDVWVQGEISNLSRPSSGHLYFTLKDADSTLRCVMWRPNVSRQIIQPRVGEAVEAHGKISIYEASGQYQLYADLIRPLGEGLLYQEFQRLKARLEVEGLFDPERKRPVPAWPHRIGVVTSPTGAAFQDVLNTLRRRFPLVEVILAPTLVQGDDAPPGIKAALAHLNDVVHPDVILLARGGGSIEDLWAFNDERVVRAVVNSTAPVITGIGHETDFTLADFAADLRAPTPTAAAELATPNQADLRVTLSEIEGNIGRAFESIVQLHQYDFQILKTRLARSSPIGRIQTDRQRLDDLSVRSEIATQHYLELLQARLAGQAQRLTALSPSAVLSRGFAIVTGTDGEVVWRVDQVDPGDDIQVRVSDGSFGAKVDEG